MAHYGSTIPHFRVYQNTPTGTQFTQPPPPSSQPMFMDLKKCANRSCKRTKISAKCAKALCAICCVMLLDACSYAAHDRKRAQEHAARTAQPKLHGPWSVMHPLPADIPDTNRIRPLAPLSPPTSQSLPRTSQPLRPPPPANQLAIPVDPSQSDSEANTTIERRHRKEFQQGEWKDSWARQEADRRRREDAETLRRENVIAMKQSFRLAFWGDNSDAGPLRTTVDYVLTWPTFALSQSPEILALLNLPTDDYIDTYVVSARYWQTQKTSKPFHLVTGELLLFRRRGVVICNGIDAVIEEAVGEQTIHTPVPPTLSVTVVAPKSQPRAKRRLENVDGDEERPASMPRLSLAHLSPNTIISPSRTASLSPSKSYCTVSPSPSPDPQPLVMSPSPLRRLPPSPKLTSVHTPQPSVLDPSLSMQPVLTSPPPVPTAEPSSQQPSSQPLPALPLCSLNSLPPALNLTGLGLGTVDWAPPLAETIIHVPPGARWPDEFFACDVASGFYTLGRMIANSRHHSGRRIAVSKTAMFAQIFPGVHYSSSNMYANWKFWTDCSEQERQQLAQTPRTPEGRWKQCRQSLPAWKSRIR